MDEGDSELYLGTYNVEKIVDLKTVNGKVLFRVRWEGYPPEEDTWEPFAHVAECEEALEEFWEWWSRQKGNNFKSKEADSVREASNAQSSAGKSQAGSATRLTIEDFALSDSEVSGEKHAGKKDWRISSTSALAGDKAKNKNKKFRRVSAPITCSSSSDSEENFGGRNETKNQSRVGGVSEHRPSAKDGREEGVEDDREIGETLAIVKEDAQTNTIMMAKVDSKDNSLVKKAKVKLVARTSNKEPPSSQRVSKDVKGTAVFQSGKPKGKSGEDAANKAVPKATEPPSGKFGAMLISGKVSAPINEPAKNVAGSSKPKQKKIKVDEMRKQKISNLDSAPEAKVQKSDRAVSAAKTLSKQSSKKQDSTPVSAANATEFLKKFHIPRLPSKANSDQQVKVQEKPEKTFYLPLNLDHDSDPAKPTKGERKPTQTSKSQKNQKSGQPQPALSKSTAPCESQPLQLDAHVHNSPPTESPCLALTDEDLLLSHPSPDPPEISPNVQWSPIYPDEAEHIREEMPHLSRADALPAESEAAETNYGDAKSHAVLPEKTELVQHLHEPERREGHVSDGMKESLQQAVKVGNYDAILKYVKSPGEHDLELVNDRGTTLLMTASNVGYTEIVELLALRGANLNAKHETTGKTPIMLAAEKGRYNIVFILGGLGARLNVADVSGETALMKAYRSGHYLIVHLLLDCGADFTIRPKPEVMARWPKHKAHAEIEKLIQGVKTRVESEFYDQIKTALDGNANLIKPLFPVKYFALNEDTTFSFSFKNRAKKCEIDEGMLLFVAHAVITCKEVNCRLSGPSAVISVLLNGIDQPSMGEETNEKYAMSLISLNNGDNNLVLRTHLTPNTNVKLMVQAYKVKLTETS